MTEEKDKPVVLQIEKAPPLPLKILNIWTQQLKDRPFVTLFASLCLVAIAGFGVQYKLGQEKDTGGAQVVINAGGDGDGFDDPVRNDFLELTDNKIDAFMNATAWSHENGEIYPMSTTWDVLKKDGEIRERSYQTTSSKEFNAFRRAATGEENCTKIDMGAIVSGEDDSFVQYICGVVGKKDKLLGFVTAMTEGDSSKLRSEVAPLMQSALE